MENKKTVEVSTLLDFKPALQDDNEDRGHWKDTDLWDKMESSEVRSHIYAQLISDKSTKTNEWESLFNQRFKDNWTTSCK